MMLPSRILVVEDDPASLELVTYLLTKDGHACITARDGIQGLRKALEDSPDLILCDLQIPGLTGFQVARALRSDSAWRRVPLVAVTALSMPGDRERAVEAGFDGYLTKPIDPETFVSEIRTFLPEPPRTKGG